jgi:hypothetical protein
MCGAYFRNCGDLLEILADSSGFSVGIFLRLFQMKLPSVPNPAAQCRQGPHTVLAGPARIAIAGVSGELARAAPRRISVRFPTPPDLMIGNL